MADMRTSMRATAQATIHKMTAGMFTVQHVVDGYDPSSGESSESKPANMRVVIPGAIDDNKAITIKNKNFQNVKTIVLLAGNDLGVVESIMGINDKITLPNGKVERITAISSDQYGACYVVGLEAV